MSYFQLFIFKISKKKIKDIIIIIKQKLVIFFSNKLPLFPHKGIGNQSKYKKEK